MEALVREMCEELGIEIDSARAVSVLQHSPYPDLDIEIWAVERWDGDIVNAAPDEHDEIRWFAINELDSLDLADASVAAASRCAIDHFG